LNILSSPKMLGTKRKAKTVNQWAWVLFKSEMSRNRIVQRGEITRSCIKGSREQKNAEV